MVQPAEVFFLFWTSVVVSHFVRFLIDVILRRRPKRRLSGTAGFVTAIKIRQSSAMEGKANALIAVLVGRILIKDTT